ncbi:MAG: hypothetical protein EOP87_25785 [Verrucomicrobiaceae bacterium]|nr:MAG: hypothetical protein EOP87_25785 [Verrucomicrobiaceae bacterium]
MVIDDGGSAMIQSGVNAPGKWAAPGFFHDRQPNECPAAFFSPAFRHENKSHHPYHTGFTLQVSYWLLILLYLGTLTAIHLGWSRRRARLIIASSIPPRHDLT